MTTHVPSLALPPGLMLAAAALPPKDQQRLDDTLTRLHATNSHLWLAEDRVRGGLSESQVADCKREIDQLNAERNNLAERADEVLAALAGPPLLGAVRHTETLSSALDRLSVLTLRIWHSEEAATFDSAVAQRIPLLHKQRAALSDALDSLAADVAAGTRLLPTPARFKLYGGNAQTDETVTPSRHLQRVIAFGGLSESGKSTGADYVRQLAGAQRFKIGYLLRQAAHHHGLADPYRLSARRQAELLLEELNRFAEAHVEARLFTIESVHDNESIAELKALLGDRLQVVYLSAPFDVRVARSGTPPHAVAAKDAVKIQRGADKVEAMADHVIDNSGSVVDLRARLRRIAETSQLMARVQVGDVSALGLPTAVAEATAAFARAMRSAGAPVRLAALTGSPSTGPWVAGWSDIDLFVISEHQGSEQVSVALKTYQAALDGLATVGLTLVTPDELTARRLTPRLAFVLHQIQDGQPVLHAAPGLELPVITRRDLVLAGAQDLPQVILTMRRLRAGATAGDLRPLYRHLVLTVRLLLREQGVWASGPDEILTAAAQLPGLPPLAVPTLASVVDEWLHRGTDGALQAVSAAVDHLLAWYAVQVSAA
ncbi:DUF4254 domain-containing protein [Streptomyces sp. NBC_01216]|uniref:DUF4254 domain-containing protein n=1 Tax=Streptomyces sp. NBC_01216 TaxID=2903778 RepID=UPI002E16691D|nr:DUF4254 domain-containing protein [Streptomyces sp. NBC_01216]